MRTDMVHEDPVVGDKNKGAFERQQKFFKPFDCVQIQVVCRFVKQKHIRAGYKDTGELRPFTPAAGKLAQAERPFAFIET